MLISGPLIRYTACLAVFMLSLCASVRAQDLNTIGATLLEAVTTNLNGAGIRVGQPEATGGVTNDWEVNPGVIPLPVSRFTWYSNGLSSTTFPNSLGTESGHADFVGQLFYGSGGMATNVVHVDNFEANSYLDDFVVPDVNFSGSATDAIVNQSYTIGHVSVQDQETWDSYFDNFSVKYKTLFVSAADNGAGSVAPPGTSYNCICVGADEGYSCVGPTIDNGRCKPDIVAPGMETSFTTPYVAGAAALLTQAGRSGDGGADTNSASDMRTVKALLLNGAVKQANWTNVPPSPLDYTNGAGMLNVFNSYEELIAGKHSWNFSTNVPIGTAHPPVVISASIPSLNGWDFNTNNSSSTKDAINHYFFTVTNGVNNSNFTLTVTLVWNRHENETSINNLDLYLYNTANSNLVAASTSVVDNVQQVFVRQLPQGRYDLQVWKAGGPTIVSTSEPYALAWQMASESLTAREIGTNFILSWPLYPAGYAVASTPSLAPPIIWSTNNIPGPTFTNGQNVIVLSATNSAQFFRLQTPNF